MPLRPDLSGGLNLSRRATTPVKLPKMNFPMIGGVPESAPVPSSAAVEPAHQAPPGAVEGTVPMPREESVMEEIRTGIAPAPTLGAPAAAPVALSAMQAGQVIVYGRSGCAACMEAIQDLIDRQVSFTYRDVSRDAAAMQHLQAICGASGPVVPVIITIGFAGAA